MTTATIDTEVRGAAAAPGVVLGTKELYEALRAAARFAAKKPQMKVLAAALCEVTNRGLRVTCTDFDTRFTVHLGAPDGGVVDTGQFDADDGSASVAVPAAEATATLRRLVGRVETVRVSVRGESLAIVHDHGEVLLAAGDTAEFPAPTTYPYDLGVDLPYSALAQLYRVSVAVGHDQTLPVLTTIRLLNSAGVLRAQATDRFRFAEATTEGASGATWEALVPAAVWKQTLEALKPPKGADPAVVLDVHGVECPIDGAVPQARWLRVRCGNAVVETHLGEGSFPRLEALFGDDPTLVGSVGRVALREAAATAAAALEEKAGTLAVEFDHEKVTVTGAGESTTVVERLPGVRGQDTSGWVGVNASLLLEGLAALCGDTVTFSRHKVTGPVWVDDGDPEFRYIVMPRRRAQAAV